MSELNASAPVAYDRVTRRLHWINAALAAATIALAWAMLQTPRHSDARGWALTLHASCGILILVLMIVWNLWHLRHPAPPLRPALNWVEVGLARATHVALLLLFVAMPLSGYVGLAAAGCTVSFFGLVQILPLVAADGRLSQIAIALHLVGQFLIYGLVAMHAAAALMHGFIRRDGILERMLPRRP
jgi:cytochrome b561